MSNKKNLGNLGFVDEGTVVLRELGLEGLIAPIPEDECAILALVPGAEEKVYGLTHGTRSHLFVYHNFPVEDGVLRLGAIAENISGGSLVCTNQDVIYGVVYGETPEHGIHSVMFKYDGNCDNISGEQALDHGKPIEIPCPFAGKKLSNLVIDRKSNTIFGITFPDHMFFAYEVETGRFREIGHLGEGVVSKVICLADGPTIYGVGNDGVVFRFLPAKNCIEITKMVIPCGKSKDYVNEATALAYDADRHVIYGGTLLDGYLFKIKLDSEKVICLGRPIEQRPIRCLALGHDGKLFGIAGEPKSGICHLFRYDPESGDLRDLGIPRSTITKSWVAHEIDAMCVDRNGHVIMGENDRMAHLLVYYPPVEKRQEPSKPF